MASSSTYFVNLSLIGSVSIIGMWGLSSFGQFNGPEYKTYQTTLSIPKSTAESPKWYVVASSFLFNANTKGSLSESDLKFNSGRLQLDAKTRETISAYYAEVQSMSSSYTGFTGEYVESDPYVQIAKSEGLVCVASDGSLAKSAKTAVSLPSFFKASALESSTDGKFYVRAARSNQFQFYPDNTIYCSNQGQVDAIDVDVGLTFLTPYAFFGERPLSVKGFSDFYGEEAAKLNMDQIVGHSFWNIRSILTNLQLNRLAELSTTPSPSKDELSSFASKALLNPNSITIEMDFSNGATKTIQLPASVAKGSFVEVYQRYFWGAANRGLITLPLAAETERSKKKLKKYQNKRELFVDQDASPMAFTCKIGSQTFVDSTKTDLALDIETNQEAQSLTCSLNVPKKHGKLAGQATIQVKILEKSSLEALSKGVADLRDNILNTYASDIEKDRAIFLKNYFDGTGN